MEGLLHGNWIQHRTSVVKAVKEESCSTQGIQEAESGGPEKDQPSMVTCLLPQLGHTS